MHKLRSATVSLDSSVVVDFHLTGNVTLLEGLFAGRMLVSNFVTKELADADIQVHSAAEVVLSADDEWDFFHDLRKRKQALGSVPRTEVCGAKVTSAGRVWLELVSPYRAHEGSDVPPPSAPPSSPLVECFREQRQLDWRPNPPSAYLRPNRILLKDEGQEPASRSTRCSAAKSAPGIPAPTGQAGRTLQRWGIPAAALPVICPGVPVRPEPGLSRESFQAQAKPLRIRRRGAHRRPPVINSPIPDATWTAVPALSAIRSLPVAASLEAGSTDYKLLQSDMDHTQIVPGVPSGWCSSDHWHVINHHLSTTGTLHVIPNGTSSGADPHAQSFFYSVQFFFKFGHSKRIYHPLEPKSLDVFLSCHF